MESFDTTKGYERKINQINNWLDQFLLNSSPLLPSQQQKQQKKSLKHAVLKSFWFRLFAIFYILFSIFLTSAHFLSWFFNVEAHNQEESNSSTSWYYQRTYDADEPYSLISNMSHGLKMSKLFSQGHYDALKYVQPYWLQAVRVFNPTDVTLYTTITPGTWKDLVELADSWDGPISATFHISKSEKQAITNKIEHEYKSNPKVFSNVDIHLIETDQGIEKRASITVPLNVERNLARIHSKTQYVAEIPTNVLVNANFRQNWIANKKRYTSLLDQGDLLVIPLFKMMDNTNYRIPTNKEEVLAGGLALHDAHFELDDGPTDFETWKNARDIYAVKQYTMDYEPIVIQSKNIQPWCSERFVDKKSACLLPSYLAGNNFLVLPNDFAVQKPRHEQKTAISDLDIVIEKRLYSKFYWEQCVYQGRQLDALGLWQSKKSEHIRQQCSRVIQNWGKGLIGKPE